MIFVSLVLLFLNPAAASSATPQLAEGAERSLKIFVLQGKSATNSIPAGRIVPPIVEVRNEDDHPVEGAEVTFELPDSGPGGEFPQGQQKQTVRTNFQGQATVRFIPNQQPGHFEINVTARSGNRVGQTTIMQINSLEAFEPETARNTRKWTSKWKLLAIGGGVAGAVVGILFVTRNGGNSNGPTIVISPGGPVFGGTR